MPATLKHLLLTTVEDPWDVKSWSGIPFHLREALERKVERLTVFVPGPPSRNLVDVVKRLWYGGIPPKYPLWMTKSTLRENAREVKAEISRVNPDAVLSISSQCLAMLEDARRPLYFFSDAPWLAWHEAYKDSTSAPVNMYAYAQREARLAARLDGICFGSAWAIAEGERLYAGDFALRERMHVTPLGANWVPQVSREKVLERVHERSREEIVLLYVGKDWERKGGPMAVEVTRALYESGHKVTLHIVGCRPVLAAETTSYTMVHGLLYQNDLKQSAQLAELFHQSHFLLVPTLAECFGIVFAEAQAFALPPIARAVHALPSVIADGQTGLLMDPAAPASAYVERILALNADFPTYRNMAIRARDRYETLLNWDHTAEEIVRLISLSLNNKVH